jgi:hypothetical protein
MMARHAEVVARWVVRRQRARKQGCAGCGTRFDGVACPACGLVGRSVAVQAMALVIELHGGTRTVVVAERAPGGRWVAVQTMPATPKAIAALRRQHEADELGGLFGSAA